MESSKQSIQSTSSQSNHSKQIHVFWKWTTNNGEKYERSKRIQMNQEKDQVQQKQFHYTTFSLNEQETKARQEAIMQQCLMSEEECWVQEKIEQRRRGLA